jgi:hypothetical protein
VPGTADLAGLLDALPSDFRLKAAP